ncbi:amidohydrolase family protein [Thermomicrobiaceae bacterium CFH 74404]|uniref:Amidohydrolase family protein n=1 Tax=Thermalbibacter longus TaxID=2951981 RepID=A0AA41WH39_9BACT|nr:amidohydrolase family protein [Thermalbibacter longus]MCM8750519.1 amidohydrolase family protein [Thermalbibacter longus]
MKIAITNVGTLFTGVFDKPIDRESDTLVIESGIVTAVGSRDQLAGHISEADQVIDANGMTVAPGLIDSHCHVVIGDYTPRQKTVDFLESYVHGGVTSVVSASEVHAPGRPHDRHAVKALAVAAYHCYAHFHPAGMKVHAGSVILEPSLTEDDFRELAEIGIRLAKFGFGDYADPMDGEPQVRWAKQHGMVVMSHCGGASIPGSQPILARHLMHLRPHVLGHINGGPTSLPDEDVDTLVTRTDMALQIVQAGNLRSALRIVNLARETGNLHRVIIGTDTPTGTGVMPLGMLKTIVELSSLADFEPEVVWSFATGNNAAAYRLHAGVLEPGYPADLVVIDAPWGSVARDARSAIARGDIPGIAAVVIDGQLHTLRSRNTPPSVREVHIQHRRAAA